MDLDDRFGSIAWMILLADIVDMSLCHTPEGVFSKFQVDKDGRIVLWPFWFLVSSVVSSL